VGDPDADRSRRRAVRRGEGEVTQWPRGLSGYVPSGPEDDPPSPEEDRLTNRVRLAARLLSVLRGQGRDVDALVRQLADAESALKAGDRPRATVLLDGVLAGLDRAGARPPTRT
jgi:hypothetical protein